MTESSNTLLWQTVDGTVSREYLDALERVAKAARFIRYSHSEGYIDADAKWSELRASLDALELNRSSESKMNTVNEGK